MNRYILDANIIFSALISGKEYPILTRDKKLYNGLKNKGFEKIILLGELMNQQLKNE